MNREIKFRAWLKKEKKMVQVSRLPLKAKNGKYEDGQSVGWYYTDQASYNDYDIDYSNIEDIELMQYVGLKDKNGKEIYEGDIIDIHQTVNGQNLFVVEITNTGLVIPRYAYKQGFKYQYDIRELLEVNEYDKEIEVIGNIYENLELLEVE